MSDNHDEPLQRVMPTHPLGIYLRFADFRDASKDVVPVRTRPATGKHPDSGWVEAVFDEAEWLARPDLWAVDLFPRAKGELAEYYSVTWLADNFVECKVCRILLDSFWHGGAFDASALKTAPEWIDSRRWTQDELETWKRTEPQSCICEPKSFHHSWRLAVLGHTTTQELLNRWWEKLAGPSHYVVGSPEQKERSRRRRFEGWEYGRNLALDLCGPNPFRPVAFDPRWRSESAVALARTAYDTRDFTLLPILADALEEAGCDHPDILIHCRDPQQFHVRGCWVVDGVLGKT